MKKKLLLVLAILVSTNLFSQVSVAPPVIFLKDNFKFSTLIVDNRTEIPQEVSIYFKFGYPVSDSVGNVTMLYNDTAKYSKYSIHNFLKAFPPKFILMPGQKQNVRIQMDRVRSSLLNPNTYWSRIVTSASPQKKFVNQKSSGNITTQVSFIIEQITTIIYSNTNSESKISISDTKIQQKNDSLFVNWKATVNGNAPYFSTCVLKILDIDGMEIRSVSPYIESVSMYFYLNRNAILDISSLKHGKYFLSISYEANKSGVQENYIISPPMNEKIKFEIK